MRKIFTLSALSLLILSGCATDDPRDGLIGDELQSPLVEIADHIKSGDGKAFCRHVEVQFRVECPEDVAPSMGVADFYPEILDLPSGQLFGFSTQGLVLDIERFDFEVEGETYYEWIVRDFSMPSLLLPEGGKYAGVAITEGSSFSIMPGAIDQELLELNTDPDGYWEASLNADGTVSYELADDSIQKVTKAFEEFCVDFSSRLQASDLLSPASTFFGGKQGQEDNAVNITYVNPGSNQSETRVLNFPKITQADCSIDEESVAADGSGTGAQDFSALAYIEVLLEGDTEMEVDKDFARGIYTYDWLPREFQATLSINATLSISSEANEFYVTKGPDFSSPWLIDEPIVDLYDGP